MRKIKLAMVLAVSLIAVTSIIYAKEGIKIEAKNIDALSKNKNANEEEILTVTDEDETLTVANDEEIVETHIAQDETITLNDNVVDEIVNQNDSDNNVISLTSSVSSSSSSSHKTDDTTKKSADTKSKDKNSKVPESQSTPVSGRIEISSLNIKSDLSSSQIKYSYQGLNNVGNTVLYFEDGSFKNLSQDTVVYVRNSFGDSKIYTVYNSFNTSVSDNSFYYLNTNDCELSIVVKLDEQNVMVFQAREQ